jgi:hypothetical protein
MERAEAEGRVRLGKHHVAQQRLLIADLAPDGHDTTAALGLLANALGGRSPSADDYEAQ